MKWTRFIEFLHQLHYEPHLSIFFITFTYCFLSNGKYAAAVIFYAVEYAVSARSTEIGKKRWRQMIPCEYVYSCLKV